jgi:PEP-CTERM motif
MKRQLVLVLIVSLALLPAGAAWAATLSLTGPALVPVGGIFEEKLWVTQDASLPGIGDFELGISFIGANFVSYTLGPSLGSVGTEALDLTDPGSPPADLAELSLLSVPELLALQTDQTFLLATLTFECAGLGVSSFSIVASSNAGLFTLGDASGNALSFDTVGNRVSQGGSQVPEPGILIVLATGVIGGAFVSRRARK